MFERFTERAKQVIVLSQDEARSLKHNYIGTEHILLGLLREEEGVAARVLESFDVSIEGVRTHVVRIVGHGEVTTGKIPFTPRAKKALELALREALSLGHNYVGTEHVLLGLVRENEGIAARILLDFADADKIRGEIVRMLTPQPGRRQLVVNDPTVELRFTDKDQQKRVVDLSFDPSPKEPPMPNGKLNEETIAVLEQTMLDTHSEIFRLEQEVRTREGELAYERRRLARAQSTMAALAKSVGSEPSSEMWERVSARNLAR